MTRMENIRESHASRATVTQLNLSNCHLERASLAEASSMRDGKPIQWFAPYRADSRD